MTTLSGTEFNNKYPNTKFSPKPNVPYKLLFQEMNNDIVVESQIIITFTEKIIFTQLKVALVLHHMKVMMNIILVLFVIIVIWIILLFYIHAFLLLLYIMVK